MGGGGRWVVGLAVLAAVAGSGLAWPPFTESQRSPQVGQVAPEITGGPWLNSAPLSLAELRGRVVFVEFWTYG
jgi:hypothetical protein